MASRRDEPYICGGRRRRSAHSRYKHGELLRPECAGPSEQGEGERRADQDGDGLGVGAPHGVRVLAVSGEGVRGAVEAGEADPVLGGGPEVERGGADGEEEAAEDAEEDHAVRVVRVQRDRLRPPVRQVHRGGGLRAPPRRWQAGEMRGGEIWERRGGLVAGGDASVAAVFLALFFSFFGSFKSLIRSSRSDQMAG